MLNYRNLPLIIIINLFIAFNATAQTNLEKEVVVEKANKEIMKITEHGFEPSQVIFKQLDGSVFFLNATNDALLSLEINFDGRRAHCASDNIVYQDGVMRTKSPLAPQDFALMCFPEKGSYDVIVRGLSAKPSIVGKVLVQ